MQIINDLREEYLMEEIIDTMGRPLLIYLLEPVGHV